MLELSLDKWIDPEFSPKYPVLGAISAVLCLPITLPIACVALLLALTLLLTKPIVLGAALLIDALQDDDVSSTASYGM